MCEIMQEIKNEGIAEGQRTLVIQMFRYKEISLTSACSSLNLSEEKFLALENGFEH